jgi:lipopolysaccharide transport system ATP-binding protein
MKPIIRVDNLGKQYRIGARQASYATLREALAAGVTRPLRWLRGERHAAENTFWALKNVHFEIRRGETVGILGRNGAGKSTLLKILSRVTEPTTGQGDLYGRVGSLLEVGTGFHPELTGRENVSLSGAVLGMKRAEIRRKFDDIVDFAGVAEMIDTPVKRYSSGMYLRLAFAVAVHLEPEILLVDEVLAVGDAAFQKKCLDKMAEVSRSGATVLFVSHNLAAVRKLCPRSLLLQDGGLIHDGDTCSALRIYMGEGAADRLNLAGRRHTPKRVAVANAWLEREGQATSQFLFDDVVTVMIEVEVLEETRFSVELILRQADGVPVAFAPSGLAQDWEVTSQPGRRRLRAQLPPLQLAAGPYSLDILLAETGVRLFDRIESALSFRVDSSALGSRNWHFRQSGGQGHALWDVRYSVDE